MAPAAIFGCLYLFFSPESATKLMFASWTALGALVYLGYGYRRSRVGAAVGTPAEVFD